MFKSGMERVALVVRHGIGFKVRLALDAVHLALVHLALKYKQALFPSWPSCWISGLLASSSQTSSPHVTILFSWRGPRVREKKRLASSEAEEEKKPGIE